MVRGVLYLEKDKFQLSIDNRIDVLSYVFPPTLVNNSDILDEEALILNITEFIKKNGVVMTNLIIVLSSSVIFEQDFKTEQEPLIQEFLDNVPYETISVKKIPFQGGTKVLIGNATFYTFLADIFKQNGAKLDYVIPEKALGGNIGAFNTSTARLILTQFEALSQNKFVTDESTENKIEYKPTAKKTVALKKNATLLYSLPIMGLLVLVLGFMILAPMISNKKTNNTALAANLPTLSPKISPIVAVSPTSLPSPQLRKPATVQILFDPTSSVKADQIKASLAALGFQNIQTISTASNIPTPVMSVASDIDPAEKQKNFTEVQKILPNVLLQESTNQTIDIVITIGKTL